MLDNVTMAMYTVATLSINVLVFVIESMTAFTLLHCNLGQWEKSSME